MAKRASDLSPSRRHLFIPDTQVRPGVPLDHIAWVAQAIVDYRPDVVIVGGDFWDMPSLNSHESAGSEALEGGRYRKDVEAGNVAFTRLCKPMERELAKKGNTWKPRKVFLCGNHEHRADRVAASDPKWLGHVGTNNCNVRDFEWFGFLRVVEIDGVNYSHYFQNTHSKHAIGGSVENRLNKICASFVQGHEQGLRFGTRITAIGRTLRGVVAGSCYLHTESYRGPQGARHWQGVIVLNEVRNGEFGFMDLSLDYLCRKYEGISLHQYMTKTYRDGDWFHLADAA